MHEVQNIKNFSDEVLGDTYLGNCFIEVRNNEYSTVLSANREGMLLLINELIKLYESNKVGYHYHLDEGGMARKCDKPIVIELVKENWQL